MLNTGITKLTRSILMGISGFQDSIPEKPLPEVDVLWLAATVQSASQQALDPDGKYIH